MQIIWYKIGDMSLVIDLSSDHVLDFVGQGEILVGHYLITDWYTVQG